MSFYINGSKVGRLGVLSEPPTYDADITPADMQLGTTAYAQGKKLVGTGRAFEFASYGSRAVKKIVDSQGVERYGIFFDIGEHVNVLFIAPSVDGDVVLQTNHKVDISSDRTVKLGNNQTSGGEINAYYDVNRVIVYLTNFSQKNTILRFFVGKDNHL